MSRARSLANMMNSSGLIEVEKLALPSPTQQIFDTAGTFTWTKPAGCKKVKVTVIGGGGGGGAARGTDSTGVRVGGAGGGGGTSIKTIDVTSITSETVTVGAGGAGATSANTYANTGGTSSYGSHCSATGGLGGRGNYADAGSAYGLSRGGGLGENGDLNIAGGTGFMPQSYGEISTSIYYVGTIGGSSYLNNTQFFPNVFSGVYSNQDGAYGSGGNGGLTQNTTSNGWGGDGGDGIVIVEEFYV